MPHAFYLRAAACTPDLRVADPRFNAEATLKLWSDAAEVAVELCVFPEMGLTGYTCGDLFHQQQLLTAAEDALAYLLKKGPSANVCVVGLPVVVDGMLFNCAAVLSGGKLLGVVPKSHLPNYREFYDARYFHPAADARSTTITLAGQYAPFGTDLLFECASRPGFTLGVEICEDLWTPIAPSAFQALAGATILGNLSASNEVIGKAPYRRELVASQSGRCIAGYVYAGCGPHESSTDLVFGGHCLIAENGGIVAESERFREDSHFTMHDFDLDRIARDRLTSTTFHNRALIREYRRIPFEIETTEKARLVRDVEPHPFVPANPATRDERCREIFATQVAALRQRLSHVAPLKVAIGVSGGLDSTLALLVLFKACSGRVTLDHIHAFTMPGFGTTPRTLGNARRLMNALGLPAREIDIRPLCLAEMLTLGHSPFGIDLDEHTPESFAELLKRTPPDRGDLVFENVQARVRTSLLMNTGFVVGTGDVSELALGWCTYNADHTSMYNPNASIPKTLVKFLVTWAAEHEFDGETRETLLDIAATTISPELLPVDAKGLPQNTESSVGPYELVDFFLYHFLRWGATPEKILYLAGQAMFDVEYSPDELKKWLKLFLKRFFANQFKRSCLPDGPKVGTIALSPRGDWRMPSDASVAAWLED